ncbi:MAG TPA: succinyl-diaminopimelate desuccinylase [Rhizomicrobium sp.]|jgi:succinyl-diaminopimelate desuccinylase
MIDAIALSQDLIRCPSVTPKDEGAIAIVEKALSGLGFTCKRMRLQAPGSEAVENLYARLGAASPNFCFAGHTDVVPVGDAKAWRHDPFAAQIDGGTLYGRGAADMKSAIACFIAAVERVLAKGKPKGSISLLITGDEEGININGTKAVLEVLKKDGERIDHCLVGEPTATARTADTIKIGRRGSMKVTLTVTGVQGHTAYPQNALNPIPILAALITKLSEPLDSGSAHFQPSTLVFTTVDVGNPAGNVSPAQARASLNIRFNDLHTPESLLRRIEKTAHEITNAFGGECAIEHSVSGVSFITRPGPFTDLLGNAIAKVTGVFPEYSTTGGTSDARFIREVCPVAEVGVPGGTMHKVDECVPVKDLHRLVDVYAEILETYFANPPG